REIVKFLILTKKTAKDIRRFWDSDDGNELEESHSEDEDSRSDRESSRYDDSNFDLDVELSPEESDVECERSSTSKKISSSPPFIH
ncbi:hypothetical protein HHI36_004438, partial [Cryptolaemus montrouzieri]